MKSIKYNKYLIQKHIIKFPQVLQYGMETNRIKIERGFVLEFEC